VVAPGDPVTRAGLSGGSSKHSAPVALPATTRRLTWLPRVPPERAFLPESSDSGLAAALWGPTAASRRPSGVPDSGLAAALWGPRQRPRGGPLGLGRWLASAARNVRLGHHSARPGWPDRPARPERGSRTTQGEVGGRLSQAAGAGW